jgi:hypothetical protein
VLATDKPQVLEVLAQNLEANGVLAPAETAADLPAGSVAVEALAWSPSASHPLAPFDVVLACECMYSRGAVPLILQTLWRLSGQDSTIIFSGIVGADTMADFLAQVGTYFDVEARDQEGRVLGSRESPHVITGGSILILRRKELLESHAPLAPSAW